MKKNIFIIISFLFCFEHNNAQTLKAYLAAADNAFATKDYHFALVNYTKVLEIETDRIDIQYQAAEAARLFDAYSLSEEKYQKVLDQDTNLEYPIASFWLANIKQKKGKYQEAKDLYKLYLSESNGDDDYFTAKAEKEIQSCDWALEVVNNPDISIKVKHLGQDVNTEYSEFGSLSRGDSLWFSSMRFDKTEDIYDPARLVSKILVNHNSTSSALEGSINQKDDHIAHNTFNKNGDKIIYTECQYINNSDIRCNLYYRSVDAYGNFGEAIKLPENINLTAATSTQPSIGYNDETGEEILFFASDRIGGKGKLDIWYSVIGDDFSFSDPINCMGINTTENDITPFYATHSDELYFSSEGYHSLGGYDIYKSKVNSFSFQDAEHLPAPLNSSYHDLYYSVDTKGENSYFSSNREGSIYLEPINEACCYDIYKVEKLDIAILLDVQTFDKLTNSQLLGTKVKLIDPATGKLITELLVQDVHQHIFEIQTDREYLIVAEKEGFLSDTISFNSTGYKPGDEIIKKLLLANGLWTLDAFTFDEKYKTPLTGATLTLYDEDTRNLVGSSIFNSDNNQFNWDILPNKNYKLVASKNGYLDATVRFNATNKNNGNKIIKELYLSRNNDGSASNDHPQSHGNALGGPYGAGNSSLYLPVSLYFDNDRPDVRSRKPITVKNYTDTYHPYIAKEEEFVKKYTQPLSSELKIRNEQALRDFFLVDVRGGYTKLGLFLQSLKSDLEKGQKIQVVIKGFASPRAKSKYNLALGQRRVNNLKNEFYTYNSGVLKQYLSSGQLSFKEISFGEQLAPGGISDVLDDIRNSVYSIEASKERRVEILKINYK